MALIVYISSNDLPIPLEQETHISCELTFIKEYGPVLQGEGWELGGFGGNIYDEEGNLYSRQDLTRLLLLEEAKKLYNKMDAAGVLDEFKEQNAVAAITFVVMAENGQIDDTTAVEHITIFSPWESSVQYKVGDIRRDSNKLYRCLQAHTSQEGWNPETVPALWARIGDPTEEWPEWSQPIGSSDSYMLGDKVSHNEKHWVSDYDNNVWEPGVYGWTENI